MNYSTVLSETIDVQEWISISIINFAVPWQLQKAEFGFVKLKSKDKRPFEQNWQNTPYHFTEIGKWFASGGNYGVMGGYGGLIIIDSDAFAVKQAVESKLPPTFTVRSSGNKRHSYYLCPGITSKIVLDDKVEPKRFQDGEDHYGEIISSGSQVVGPGSIHPKTNLPYEVVNNIDIVTVSKEDILSALADYLPAATFKEKDHEVERNSNLNVVDVLKKYGIPINDMGRQIQISHPIHGSTNGCNFVANGGKNVWHCFRCDSGGGAISLIAVLEGVIDCDKAVPGGLRGEAFLKTKEIACEKYGLSRDSFDEDEKVSKNQTDMVIKMLEEEKIDFFHDQYKEPHVVIYENGMEIVKLRSKNFKRWLAHHVYKKIRVVLNSNTMKSTIQILEGKAIYESPLHVLNVRVAWHEGALWYDLGDGNAVKTTKEGWSIVEQPPILFYRFAHQKPQVHPVREGNLDDILPFFNLKNKEDQILLNAIIVSSFIPDFPHTISAIYGPQGSAKSTTHRLLKRLIDPSQIETLSPPENLKELIQIASHHWLIFFDNLSWMQGWLSDAFCRICSGDSFSKRELFSDDDDIVYSFRRVLGFNGINLMASKPDLLDRSILLGLEPIPDEKRRKEKEVLDEFERIKPATLGAIFDVLVKALNEKEKVNLSHLPRMADFTDWGCAIARAMGNTEHDFLSAYNANISQQHEEAIDANPVGTAIIKFMENKDRWEDTATRLLAELNHVAIQLGINNKSNIWPREANWVWRKINIVLVNLKAHGIIVSKSKHGKRNITIEKVAKNGVTDVSVVQSDKKVEDEPDSKDSMDGTYGKYSILNGDYYWPDQDKDRKPENPYDIFKPGYKLAE
ncbi:MAG: hypothetical protein EXS48_01800 [Candidatus Staskawiczbacteria bacterium]|nr:hypothetical protein [Candidatus Staskawiczbacteria bacterium]